MRGAARIAAALLAVAALGAAVASGTFSSPSATAGGARLALEDHGTQRIAAATKRPVAKPRCRVVARKVRHRGRWVVKRVRVCRPRRAPARRLPPPVRPVPIAPTPPATGPGVPAPDPPPGPPTTGPPADVPPTPGPTAVLTDDDGDASLYAVAGASPGTAVVRCIVVTYANDDGQDADVRVYATGSPGTLDPLLDVQIEPGTRPAGGPAGCTGFVATGAPLFTGTLAQLVAAHAGYAGGVPTAPAGQTAWEDGDAVAYRISVTLRDDSAGNGGTAGSLASGSHSYVWEARYG